MTISQTLPVGEYHHLEVDERTSRAQSYALVMPELLKGRSPHEQLLMAQAMTIAELTEMRRQIDDKSRLVDEYQSQTTAATQVSQIVLTPQFQKLNVRIEHVLITGPSQGTAGVVAEGSVTSPGAAATIATITSANLPPGPYTLNWKVQLDGTVSATDLNNFKVNGPPGSILIATGTNDAAVGSYPQLPVQFTQPFVNPVAVSVKSIAAGTVGAIYSASMDITPNGGYPITLQLGDRFFSLTIPASGVLEMNPKGLLLTPQDARILVATFPGNYTLELMGWADERY